MNPIWFLVAVMLAGPFELHRVGLLDQNPGTKPEPLPFHPNVLLISVDDLNDWVGFLGGHPGGQTPNMDRLASRGVRFTRAYCAAPLCNASRAATLCGIRPSTSGVYDNDQNWRLYLPDAVSLPRLFRDQGYYTAGIGKVFDLRFDDPPSWDPDAWDEYTQRFGDPRPEGTPLNGITGCGQSFDWGPVDVDEESMGDWRAAQRAVDFLNQSHGSPFFLAVGFYRPHLPWYVPPSYFDMHPLSGIVLPTVLENDLDDVPWVGQGFAKPERRHEQVLATDNWEAAVQGYLASTSFTDACLGLVLDALDASPYADRTIIVLWADSGHHLGQKTVWHKETLWEEGTRVPLVIVAPGIAKSGQSCARTVSLLDLYPTLADLCGLPTTSDLDGESLVPLLRHPEGPWFRPAVTTVAPGDHAVRSEDWRYIRYHDGTEELYDHENDPLEWTNLANEPGYESIKAEHAAFLPQDINCQSKYSGTDGALIHIVFNSKRDLPDVGRVYPNDIVTYEPTTGAWSLLFDGKRTSLNQYALQAIALLDDGDILLATTAPSIIGLTGGPDGENITPQDIVRFSPTCYGSQTMGSWSFYFDGSDLGLVSQSGQIDAISVLPGGDLLLSFRGNLGTVKDEDVIRFTPSSLGEQTAGTWSLYFDGSDVELGGTANDIKAVSLLPGGELAFVTEQEFSPPGSGLTGDGHDVFLFDPVTIGRDTAGTFSLYLSGAAAGLVPGPELQALSIEQAP